MTLTDQQKQAAALVAAGKMTAVEIAKQVGVSPRTIFNWKGEEEFDGEVRRVLDDWRAKARGKGVADQDERLRDLNDRHKRLRAVIQQRAKDPQFQDVPGGKTGLLTVTYKMLARVQTIGDGKKAKEIRVMEPVPEYAVDTGLLAEMRQIEEHVAIELGQWKLKTENTTKTLQLTIIERLNAGRHRVAKRAISDGNTGAPGATEPSPAAT